MMHSVSWRSSPDAGPENVAEVVSMSDSKEDLVDSTVFSNRAVRVAAGNRNESCCVQLHKTSSLALHLVCIQEILTQN